MNETQEIILPWYRQFWFWFVFGPLIFIIVLCFFTVSVAFKYQDDVVTDNYYKSGLMINQTLHQDEKAAALKLRATIRFDQATREVLVSMSGEAAFPPQMQLYLDNPAKSAKDQHILLKEVSAGEYRGELTTPLEFAWYLALVPEVDVAKRKQADWLLTGKIDFAASVESHLHPRVSGQPAE